MCNIWNFSKATNEVRHFGNIPPEIIDNLLYYFTEPHDVVFDPFGGSPRCYTGFRSRGTPTPSVYKTATTERTDIYQSCRFYRLESVVAMLERLNPSAICEPPRSSVMAHTSASILFGDSPSPGTQSHCSSSNSG